MEQLSRLPERHGPDQNDDRGRLQCQCRAAAPAPGVSRPAHASSSASRAGTPLPSASTKCFEARLVGCR